MHLEVLGSPFKKYFHRRFSPCLIVVVLFKHAFDAGYAIKTQVSGNNDIRSHKDH